MLGVEELRLARLPDDTPPPALAQALDSSMVETKKSTKIITTTAKCGLILWFIFGCTPLPVFTTITDTKYLIMTPACVETPDALEYNKAPR
jgi:hypothetical protein